MSGDEHTLNAPRCQIMHATHHESLQNSKKRSRVSTRVLLSIMECCPLLPSCSFSNCLVVRSSFKARRVWGVCLRRGEKVVVCSCVLPRVVLRPSLCFPTRIFSVISILLYACPQITHTVLSNAVPGTVNRRHLLSPPFPQFSPVHGPYTLQSPSILSEYS